MAFVPFQWAGAPSARLLFTVPAGKVLIITDIHMSATGASGPVTLYCGDDGAWGGCVLWSRPLIGGRTFQVRGYYVVPAGLAVQGDFPVGSTWFQVSGLIGDATDLLAGGLTPHSQRVRLTATGDTPGPALPNGKQWLVKSIAISNIGDTVGQSVAIRQQATPVIPWFMPLGNSNSKRGTVHFDGAYHFTQAPTYNIAVAGNVVFYLSGVLLP